MSDMNSCCSCCPRRGDVIGGQRGKGRRVDADETGCHLLGLKVATLTVHKKGRRLGVMENGLAGKHRLPENEHSIRWSAPPPSPSQPPFSEHS